MLFTVISSWTPKNCRIQNQKKADQKWMLGLTKTENTSVNHMHYGLHWCFQFKLHTSRPIYERSKTILPLDI